MHGSRVDIGVHLIGPTRLFIMRASRDRMAQTSDSISSIRDLSQVCRIVIRQLICRLSSHGPMKTGKVK